MIEKPTAPAPVAPAENSPPPEFNGDKTNSENPNDVLEQYHEWLRTQIPKDQSVL